MRFFRSKIYSEYFNYLDRTGGFFYERWGDAPVHSIAAAFFLPRSQVHFFHDIGYRHSPYIRCPQDEASHLNGRCSCERGNNFGIPPPPPTLYPLNTLSISISISFSFSFLSLLIFNGRL